MLGNRDLPLYTPARPSGELGVVVCDLIGNVRGIVIPTGKYTRSARELANKNKILLLSPEDSPYMLDLRRN